MSTLPLALPFGLGDRLQRLREQPQRRRELLAACGILAFVAYYSQRILWTYPTVFAGLIALTLIVLMVHNQERTLYLLLFFSTIYMTLKATLLGWSGLAFLFKEGFLAMLVAFWAFHLILRGEKVRQTPLNKPLLVLVAWLGMECFNPNTAGLLTIIDDLRFWLGPIAVFFLTVHLVDNREKLERGLKFVFVYAVLEAVYGILQQFMPGDLLVRLGADPNNYMYFSYGSIRSFSTMGTGGFAMFASMFPCLAFFYMSQQKNPVHRAVFLVLGFVFIVGVLFTLVRAGWIAVTVAVLLYAILTRRVQVLAVMSVIVVLVFTLASGFMRTKLEGMVNYQEDPSVQNRIEIVQIVSKGVVFRVFGYGLGTFAHNRFGYGFWNKAGYGTSTENWYLMVALEIGWVGIAILVWIYIKAYGMAWHGWRSFKTGRYRELALALGGSLFAIEILRLAGPAGYFPPDSWHYYFFMGLLMVLPKADQELAAIEAGQAEAAEGKGPGGGLRRAVAA